MSILHKEFPSVSAASSFADSLGILSFQSYTSLRGGGVKLSWRVLRMRPCLGPREGFTKGRSYEVFRESALAYFIRNDSGKVIKINRLTRLGGPTMFEVAAD